MVSLHAAFAAMVLSSTGQTVLLDFYADWCGPCKAMEPTVRAIQEKGYPVQRVNIDQNPTLAAKYGVRSVPCFVMLVDGQEVDRVMGGTTFSRLERMCKITSPPQAAKSFAQSNWPKTPFRRMDRLPAQCMPCFRNHARVSIPRREDPNVIPASFTSPANATPIAAQLGRECRRRTDMTIRPMDDRPCRA